MDVSGYIGKLVNCYYVCTRYQREGSPWSSGYDAKDFFAFDCLFLNLSEILYGGFPGGILGLGAIPSDSI